MLDIPAGPRPPAPNRHAERPGAFGRPHVLAKNSSGLSIDRAAVVSRPAAIRRLLRDKCDNYEKSDCSIVLFGGLPATGGYNWRTPHSMTI